MSDMNNVLMPDNNENDPKEKMRKKVKKAAGIALCAVVAGGLAAGSFEGINTITGWNSSTVEAASSKDNKTLLQTKSSKKSKDKDSSDEDSEDSSDDTAVKGSLDVSDIAAEGMKSVVSITTKSVQDVQNYLGYYGFGGSQGYTTQQEVEGSGSGIIVGKNDDNLLIATNYHVVEGADTVSVTCIDGETYEATVNGYDEDKDLAVVSVALSDVSDDTLDEIEVATIGSSDDLKVGEQVIAIGNALGYGQSVTSGIVSATERTLDGYEGGTLIQTDAAINPGNSGGALLNSNGEVIGINTAKVATDSVEGMGYAIPISDASDTIQNLMNQETKTKVSEAEQGYLGIQGVDVSDESAKMYNMPTGVYISDVVKNGGAQQAGLTKGSVITGLEGTTISDMNSLKEQLQYYRVGDKVKVTVQVPGNNGEYTEKTVEVTLGSKS